MKLTTRWLARMLMVLFATAFLAGSAAQAAADGSAGAVPRGALIKAIVLNMGSDSAAATNAQYDKFFKQGSAAAGVAATIAAGKFFINGLAIPANERALAAHGPQGYLVNQVPWLFYDAKARAWKGGYKGQTAAASYDAAALAVATSIVAGLEVRLIDTDQDGYADVIDADFKEGVIVERIIRNGDGTVSVYRGDIDTANRTASEGKLFDGAHFTATSGEVVKASHFDASISAGNVALFWYGPNGWAMQRAREVNGIFVDGADHANYTIDGTAYADAMRFSRDNLFISNRPGEYANAQKYFGLNNNKAGLKTSLWLVPTTDPHAQGAPVGLTSNASARPFLATAIAKAAARLAGVAVSADGSDVPATKKWVTPAVHAQLATAIDRARAAAASPASTAALLDYQIYLLYLTLDGGANDIGAKFGSYQYTGFEHDIKPGTR